MHCRQVHVLQFKNLEELKVVLSPKFNCFAGHNGAGKTNVLDAIYYLSFCKSFTNPVDTQNIRFEGDYFVIQGDYQVNGREDSLYCGFKRGQRKVFKRNKKEYDRLSDHIGLYPLVLLSPADARLILGGSDERRKFVDGVIAQYNKEYLHQLIAYNKALLQRNTLLKSFAERRRFDADALEIWDEQLITHGKYIHDKRQEFFTSFVPVFRKYYAFLSGGMEETSLHYLSGLHDGDYRDQLQAAVDKDRIAQYTTVGIHKDELSFLIHGEPIKRFGSQGQQKSFIVALRLAQFSFTREIKGVRPLLLFDDIFDKLDESRVSQLMHLVSEEDFGQVFVTDTDSRRLEGLFRSIPSECKIFTMERGVVESARTLNASN